MPELESVFDEARDQVRRHAMVIDLVDGIDRCLSKLQLSDRDRAELTETIAFEVCTILDANRELVVLENDDAPMEGWDEQPLMSSTALFLGKERTKLLVSDESSSMHDHVGGQIDDLCSEG
jgi:hypothetical protein